MQSIITKYFGPGNRLGSRIIAKATGGRQRLIHSYDPALSADDNHRVAAQALITKLGWYGRWHQGAADDKGAEVFVREWPDHRASFTVTP